MTTLDTQVRQARGRTRRCQLECPGGASETTPPATATACFTAQRSTSICRYPQGPLASVLYVLPHFSPPEIPCQNLLITVTGLTVTDSDIPTVSKSQCTLGRQTSTTCLQLTHFTPRVACACPCATCCLRIAGPTHQCINHYVLIVARVRRIYFV